ncbi:hypothetical protein SARC_05897 [Sphaeroforma arctica JP610]|uniref:Threonine dehydratase n=1 Tax=Sphaeroforma arctica JP610 TaxID=667725 RepID=A0A0L0FZ05_9EUKA|nr:hypothetical protein SARC_05897 [Sphaeroforma arctica JP610]KNC81801.1 hypothetical protein SARC_05897 [Sphaeroforma arctica JP610]|eukprot:XP_014155703.1 hypothetical protein SARC_05897 [Sphaeroforma arctica JP610]
MTKKDNTPAKKRKAERKKMERETASAAAATATARATAAAADAFNRTVAEARVSDNNSQDNAWDKDVATPIKGTIPTDRARGPTIASASKLAFTNLGSETRNTSQDAPTNSSDETQKEKFPILGDKDESQKVPIPEPEQEASSSDKPESTSETNEPTLLKTLILRIKVVRTSTGNYARKRRDLNTTPVAVEPDVLGVSISYEVLPSQLQANYSPVLTPCHESPILEGIIEPEAGKNTPPLLPNWNDNRRNPVKMNHPRNIIPTTIQGADHRKASTMDFTRGNKHSSKRVNDVELNRLDRTVLHQPAEDFHSDEVTELNKSVDDYTIKIEIAHDEHRADDVSYFAIMIAIKQKRIDQLLQAQRGQDHRYNQKYKGQISRLESNWDANSKQVEFMNNHDLDTLTRTLNAFPVVLETNDIAPQQWISALMQSFDSTGTSYLILQRHQHELDTCRDWPAVKVVLHGYTYDDAAAEAKRLEKEESRVFIHPFDDPYVIAGQGTIGLEIIKQTTAKPPDAIFCCVGGGGLLSGIAEVIKTVNPNIKVFGVEAEDSAAMTLSLDKGRREELSDVGIFADGAAVKLVGENTFRICDELVDGMITVSTDEICAAIKDGFNETRTVMEPAGALGIAGVKKFIQSTGVEGKDFVVVCSGSNTNFDRLRFVAERAIENETLLCVRIPEQIGSFQTLCESIVPRNITEFSYRFNDPAEAFIMMSFQSQGPEDAKQVLKDLRVNGMEGRDLTNDETSKLHFRYLAGGRSSAPNEVLYRFQFPETPGALIRFLRNFNGVNKGWNISMFHYRNLGADVGHILVGMQIPKEQRAKDLDLFLEEVGFNYYDETDNPVYKEFFRS